MVIAYTATSCHQQKKLIIIDEWPDNPFYEWPTAYLKSYYR